MKRESCRKLKAEATVQQPRSDRLQVAVFENIKLMRVTDDRSDLGLSVQGNVMRIDVAFNVETRI